MPFLALADLMRMVGVPVSSEHSDGVYGSDEAAGCHLPGSFFTKQSRA